MLTSALNVPPQILSSQVFGIGIRSVTFAHPIKSQSFVQAFGAPVVPLPTIELTTPLEFPDNVNDLDRLLATNNRIIRKKVQSQKFTELTLIRACCVLNTTEISFGSHAYAVILIR